MQSFIKNNDPDFKEKQFLIQLYNSEIKPQIEKLPDVQGPRVFHDSTCNMHKVFLLLGTGNLIFAPDVNGNLLGRFSTNDQTREIDMSHALKQPIAFEQISLSRDNKQTAQALLLILDAYDIYRNKKEKDIYHHEKQRLSKIQDTLFLGERIALNLYSSGFYTYINDFLRKYAHISAKFFKNLNINAQDPKFQFSLLYLLAVIYLANSGLNTLQELSNTEKYRFRKMYAASENESFLEKKRNAVHNKNLLVEESFISSAMFEKKGTYSLKDGKKFNVFQLIIGDSYDITCLSRYQREYEALFAPHKLYKHLAYKKIQGQYFIISKEIMGISPEMDEAPNVSGDPDYLALLKKLDAGLNFNNYLNALQNQENHNSFFKSPTLKAAATKISSALEKAGSKLKLCSQCEPEPDLEIQDIMILGYQPGTSYKQI